LTSCTSAACAAAQAHADRIVKLRKIPIDVFASVSDLQAFKDGNEQAVAKAKEKMTKTKMALVSRLVPRVAERDPRIGRSRSKKRC
jgi:hypothetical protein